MRQDNTSLQAQVSRLTADKASAQQVQSLRLPSKMYVRVCLTRLLLSQREAMLSETVKLLESRVEAQERQIEVRGLALCCGVIVGCLTRQLWTTDTAAAAAASAHGNWLAASCAG